MELVLERILVELAAILLQVALFRLVQWVRARLSAAPALPAGA